MHNKSLGLIETQGFVAATEAADAAVKAASVEICAVEKIDGGLISIQLQGDLGAVEAAVQAGAQAAQRVGHLVSQHIIPSPHEDLVTQFRLGSDQSGTSTGDIDLERCSVVALRLLARQTPDLPIQGREVSRANRDQLIRLLKDAGIGQPDSDS
jgi:ethanolamine utilization protein EutM